MIKAVFRIEIATLLGEDKLIDLRKVGRLAMLCTQIINAGHKVIIVSSGAIVLGSARQGLSVLPESHTAKQAAAAVGMAELIRVYQHAFDEFKQLVAQVLLINDDFIVPKRRSNATNTLDKLMQHHIIPVINENDSVSLEDIVLGDNYPLALNVAKLTGAQMIVVKPGNEGQYIILNGETGEVTESNEEGVIQATEMYNDAEVSLPAEKMKYPGSVYDFMTENQA